MRRGTRGGQRIADEQPAAAGLDRDIDLIALEALNSGRQSHRRGVEPTRPSSPDSVPGASKLSLLRRRLAEAAGPSRPGARARSTSGVDVAGKRLESDWRS
jgi:hypothetical protein